ncbi:TonB-dependent receptor [Adhaeribacter aquaticus]|uniref:TonB-dependent receptor n=1 Tax=Adhaeribacter aquaticus TaxID=299567 RepID=UPI0003F68EBB|nr:TonB-dependent receptor [Adhaeribacter aquaticus]
MHFKPLRTVITLFLCCAFFAGYAQTATVTGKVLSPERQPLEGASVGVQAGSQGALTNNQGFFRLTIPADQNVVLIIRFIGFKEQFYTVQLKNGQTKDITITLSSTAAALQAVTITGRDSSSTRSEISIMRLNPKITKEFPSPFNEFNKILSTLPGVISNNELTSTYSVRGGNYDENLVYINGIEIYRPFLVTNAQQEGLSTVNPDLVGNIEFSSGGWQPKYGDKLSSVLNIDYKKPQAFGASVTGSLMGGGVHVEGTSANKRFTYLAGTRYKNAQLLFNKAIQTSGNYQPKFSDFQTYLTYDLSQAKDRGKTTLGLLATLANNKYLVIPSRRETTFGTYRQFTRLLVNYEGHERMQYNSFQGGVNLKHRFNEKLAGELIVSSLHSREGEYRNIESAYRFSDVDLNNTAATNNEQVRVREVGSSFDYSRNTMLARVFALENRYTFQSSENNLLRGGIKWSREHIDDKLNEYRFTDSADYVSLNYSYRTNIGLRTNRLIGYLQHTHGFGNGKTLTYGLRGNYWDYNKEFLISPRVQYAFAAPGNKDLTFKTAVGLYYQPPFYRELRDQAGNLNPQLKAQRSLHFIAGSEYNFKAWNRDFKFITEAYYKNLTNVVPYEVENVRLRYFAQNNAKAYAYGLDARVNGEFIKGAESWFSLGLLSTKENIAGDSAVNIDPVTKAIIGKKAIEYIRRPSDQRVTLGIFFQDHIPNDPTIKMYLNLVYGSGLPFGPPGNEALRNKFNMADYKRVDIGFSKLITLHDPTDHNKGLESLWLSLEVLNLLDANNVVSYNYISDINQTTYAVPNYLSSRLINLRFIARF